MTAPALALVGFMASGKTTVGALVARRAAVPHHDLDAMIEARCGMPIPRIFELCGEVAFRDLESELLAEALEPGAVASMGGGTPLLDRNWRLIRERAVTVWLDAPLEALAARAAGGLGRPLWADPERLRQLWLSRLPRYAEADHRVDATRPVELVAEEVWIRWHG
jgi:shikimate kinase